MHAAETGKEKVFLIYRPHHILRVKYCLIPDKATIYVLLAISHFSFSLDSPRNPFMSGRIGYIGEIRNNGSGANQIQAERNWSAALSLVFRNIDFK